MADRTRLGTWVRDHAGLIVRTRNHDRQVVARVARLRITVERLRPELLDMQLNAGDDVTVSFAVFGLARRGKLLDGRIPQSARP